MATDEAPYPVYHLPQIAPYIAIVYTVFCAAVFGAAQQWPELQDQAIPIVLCVSAAMFAQAVLASLNDKWNFDCDGSPFFCCAGNVVTQHILMPYALANMIYHHYTTITANVTTTDSTTTLVVALMNEKWPGLAANDPNFYWETVITWLVLSMLLKDLPWIIAYDCKLIIGHHLACIVGALLCFYYNADGVRMMAPGFTVVQELGSAWYTYLIVCPRSRFVNVAFFILTTLSNVAGVLLYTWHIWFTTEKYTGWWYFMMPVGCVVLYFRQRASISYFQNYCATGSCLIPRVAVLAKEATMVIEERLVNVDKAKKKI